MLIADFYKVDDISFVGSGVDAKIKLNTTHELYLGHFPYQPVVPGVVQLQIAKELLEEVLQSKLMIVNVIHVKYLVPIIPNKNSVLEINMKNSQSDDNQIKSTITIVAGSTIFTKAKIVFAMVIKRKRKRNELYR